MYRRIKIITTLLLVVFYGFLKAQKLDYFNLKDVKQFRFEKLEISNDKDLDDWQKSSSYYNFITSLKLNNQLSSIKNTQLFTDYYQLNELNLKDFKGKLDEIFWNFIPQLEILHISLNQENIHVLNSLKEIKSLKTLYVYFLEKMDSDSFISNLPNLNEIHLIGDFTTLQIRKTIDKINANPFCQTFGISIDRITELPMMSGRLSNLQKLIIYDNLSVYVQKGIDELVNHQTVIQYPISNDINTAIKIQYMSSYDGLSDFEIKYLENIFKGFHYTENIEINSEETSNNDTFVAFKKEFLPQFKQGTEFSPIYPLDKKSCEQFIINPTENSKIATQFGAEFIIPKNCFEYADKNLVNEPVYISLCFYNKPEEYAIMGINMKFNHDYLQSNIVFNIQATTAKNEINMIHGQQIKVWLPVKRDSLNEMYFDYEVNEWQSLKLYNEIFTNDFFSNDFFQIENSKNTTVYNHFDSTSFNSRFNLAKHFYLNDANINQQYIYKKNGQHLLLEHQWNKDFNKNGELKGTKIRKGQSLVKIFKVYPKTKKNNRHYFKLIDKTKEKLFSELAPFKNIIFNVEFDKETKNDFNLQYIKSKRYQDIRVIYEIGKDYCFIKLKTEKGFKIIKANLTDSEDPKKLKSDIKKFMKSYKKYKQLLDRKSTLFNTLNTERKNEYLNFLSEKKNGLIKSQNFYEMKIPQLGSFGLFSIYQPEYNTNIIAKYTTENGLPIDVKHLYLLDKRYQGCIKISVGNLSINPAFVKGIIAVDYNGELYYCNQSDISAQQIKDNSLLYIKLRKVLDRSINSNNFSKLFN